MLFNIENTEKYKKINLFGLKINIKRKPKDIINRLNRIENDINMISELLLKKLYNENIMHEVNIWNEHLYFYDTIPSNTVKFVENEINNNYEYKKIMEIDFKEGDIVIDIGANVGMVSILLAKKFPFLKIYSFEPVKSNYNNLVKNIKLNNIEDNTIFPFNMAVTKDSRDILILINLLNQGGSALSEYTNYYPPTLLKNFCHSTTLNNIVSENKIDKIKLLKIDCEGSEYEIFYNTDKKILSNIQNIIGEFHKVENEDYYKLTDYLSDYVNNIIVYLFSEGKVIEKHKN